MWVSLTLTPPMETEVMDQEVPFGPQRQKDLETQTYSFLSPARITVSSVSHVIVQWRAVSSLQEEIKTNIHVPKFIGVQLFSCNLQGGEW